MPWFTCDTCNDSIKKPKLSSHFNMCYGQYFSCVDCLQTFDRRSVQGHTSCVTEHEKYALAATKPGGFAANGVPPSQGNGNAVKAADGEPTGLQFLTNRPPWKCNLCNVPCTSRETLMAHAAGVKHKRKVRAATGEGKAPNNANGATTASGGGDTTTNANGASTVNGVANGGVDNAANGKGDAIANGQGNSTANGQGGSYANGASAGTTRDATGVKASTQAEANRAKVEPSSKEGEVDPVSSKPKKKKKIAGDAADVAPAEEADGKVPKKKKQKMADTPTAAPEEEVDVNASKKKKLADGPVEAPAEEVIEQESKKKKQKKKKKMDAAVKVPVELVEGEVSKGKKTKDAPVANGTGPFGHTVAGQEEDGNGTEKKRQKKKKEGGLERRGQEQVDAGATAHDTGGDKVEHEVGEAKKKKKLKKGTSNEEEDGLNDAAAIEEPKLELSKKEKKSKEVKKSKKEKEGKWAQGESAGDTGATGKELKTVKKKMKKSSTKALDHLKALPKDALVA